MNKAFRACIALAAFAAFAVIPATASATNDPLLTAPTGTALTPSHAAPVAISATNVGNTVMTNGSGGALLTCTTATMAGNLETNIATPTNEAKVEGTITAAAFSNSGGDCDGILGPTQVTTGPVAATGLPWCLRSTAAMATDEFQVRGNGCTSAARNITFSLHVKNLGLTCNYQRAAAIPGKFTTHPSAAQLTISGVEFVRHNSSIFCPANGFLDMTFGLKQGANTVFIDNHDGK